MEHGQDESGGPRAGDIEYGTSGDPDRLLPELTMGEWIVFMILAALLAAVLLGEDRRGDQQRHQQQQQPHDAPPRSFRTCSASTGHGMGPTCLSRMTPSAPMKYVSGTPYTPYAMAALALMSMSVG